jgi:hypothetical protein
MDQVDLFVVRVWRFAPDFRVSVRRVDDEAVHVFSSAQSVGEYLSQPAAAVPRVEPSPAAPNLSEEEPK